MAGGFGTLIRGLLGQTESIRQVVEAGGEGLDKLFSNKEEQQQKLNELEEIKNDLRKYELEAELREKELQFKEKELVIREKELNVQKYEIANDREFKINDSVNASWLSKNIMPILALMISIGTFSVIFTLIFKEVSEHKISTINLLIGMISGAFLGVVGYYFASSIGSKSKTDTLTHMANSNSQKEKKKFTPIWNK